MGNIMKTGSRNEQLVGFDISYILPPHAQGHQGQTRVKLYSIVGQEAAQDLGNGVPAEEALSPDQVSGGAVRRTPTQPRHGVTASRRHAVGAGSTTLDQNRMGQLWQQGARGGRGRGRGLHPHDQVQKRVHVSTCISTCR